MQTFYAFHIIQYQNTTLSGIYLPLALGLNIIHYVFVFLNSLQCLSIL